MPAFSVYTQRCRRLRLCADRQRTGGCSAYFSYNFKQETGRNFDGRLLLIDYGGGTLDLTLTDVETRPDKEGREGMEIRVLKRTGAGENEEGRIGQAGIAYMETLMEMAIHEVFPV